MPDRRKPCGTCRYWQRGTRKDLTECGTCTWLEWFLDHYKIPPAIREEVRQYLDESPQTWEEDTDPCQAYSEGQGVRDA